MPTRQCHAALAARHGFAQPAHVDIDSTVQEPDMQYPATSHLLVKTAIIARRIQKWAAERLPELANSVPNIDLKSIKAIAREHYFAKRKKSSQQKTYRDNALKKLWQHVAKTTTPILSLAQQLQTPFILSSLNQRQQHLLDHFIRKAPALLDGLFKRCFENLPRRIHIYSYFRDDIHCFNKMKHHKACEFGRQFQIGRLQGNFLFSIPNTSITMHDSDSIKPMLMTHINTFQTPITSLGTDKGYYAKTNEKIALDFGIEQVAIQRPRRKLDKPPNNPITDEQLTRLINRRAGIEPLIGHLKRHGQMGRSRMKSDQTTEASGFASMLGFNLRQLMRYLDKPNLALP